MQIHAAVTRVQNLPVVLVSVTRYVLESRAQADAFIRDLQAAFLGIPVVLMALNGPQLQLYGGDPRLVAQLRRAPLLSLSWDTYTVR